jgi:ABC-type sulfate transport system permease subunit
MSAPLLRTTIFLAGFAALLLWERRAPYARSGQRKSLRVLFHLGISVANSLLLYLTVNRPLLALLSPTAAHHRGVAHLLGLDGWKEIAATEDGATFTFPSFG